MFTAVAVSAATLAGVIPAACFVAGTEIITNKGSIAIENIRPGDVVLSYNESAQHAEYKEVKQVFERETEELVNISIDESIIKTTPEHPFYVVDKGWTPAKYLNVGDKLLRNDGQDVIIKSVSAELLSESQKVYNFEVADNHNYYVGEIPVLVHNDCGSTATTIGNVVTGGALSDLQIALGVGVGGIVVGGTIAGGLIDGGILEFPKSINVGETLEKVKEKVTEIVRTKQKEQPDKTIIMRLGSYTISNFLPKGKDTAGKNDNKRGLSVFVVSEESLGDPKFWGEYGNLMLGNKNFSLAFLEDLLDLSLSIQFDFYQVGYHIAIRPDEKPDPNFKPDPNMNPDNPRGPRRLLNLLADIRDELKIKYENDEQAKEQETDVGSLEKNNLLQCTKQIKSLFLPFKRN